MVIREIDNLSTQELLHFYIEYLKILQDGRAKPDKNGGYIRESVYNIDEINSIKQEINKILNIKPREVSRDPFDGVSDVEFRKDGVIKKAYKI
jgi:hypothetical protein